MTDKIIEPLANMINKTGDNLNNAKMLQKEATARLISDNESGGWFNKFIRPILSVWLITLFTILLFLDIYIDTLDVKSELQLIGSMVATIIVFYFGGRTLERINQYKVKAAIKINKDNVDAEREKQKSIEKIELIKLKAETKEQIKDIKRPNRRRRNR